MNTFFCEALKVCPNLDRLLGEPFYSKYQLSNFPKSHFDQRRGRPLLCS